MKNKLLKTSAIAYILSFIIFIFLPVSLYIGKSYFGFDTNNIFNLTRFNPYLAVPLCITVIGLSLFLTGTSDLTAYFVEKKQITNIFIKDVVYLFLLLILPFYIVFHWYYKAIKFIFLAKFRSNINFPIFVKRLIFIFFVLVFLTPLWIFFYLYSVDMTTRIVMNQLGYTPVTELVAGTGSMYPTFPKGDKLTAIAQFNQIVAKPSFISYPSGVALFGKRYFSRELKRGDIITFANKKTAEVTQKQYGKITGFMKRIIGLPGDTIELSGGIVYLNSKPLKEPYTAKPRSTFGESFLTECNTITVPKNSVFAMGDNRKGSGDSREIGFVNFQDIDHVLPIENQKGVWDKNWRNTDNDFSENAKIQLDANEYLTLLNKKRAAAGVKPLKIESKLEQSAYLRGQTILQYNDFSFEATRSGMSMTKALAKAGYSNIVYGEAPAQGYFEASELIENQFSFPKTKDFLLNKDYQDFGISEVEGKINNCPTQVIVQHFAGYIPPNYPKDVIKSWEDALNSLNSVADGWKQLKEIPQAYNQDKQDIDRLIDIINQRQTNIQAILDKMHANLWLTDQQKDYTKTIDKQLGQEEVSLAKKINDALKQ